ncbi:MAG: hypothetical protein ACI4P4_13415, partial [Faecousia sp.]
MQYEKPEIHPVFGGFSYFNLNRNLSPTALADGSGASLGSSEQVGFPVIANPNSRSLRASYQTGVAISI